MTSSMEFLVYTNTISIAALCERNQRIGLFVYDVVFVYVYYVSTHTIITYKKIFCSVSIPASIHICITG